MTNSRDDYYPEGPFRRFVFAGGLLEVARHETNAAGAPDEIFDFDLLRDLIDRFDSKDASLERLLGSVAKGFLHGEDKLHVRFVFETDSVAREQATSALRAWAVDQGVSLYDS